MGAIHTRLIVNHKSLDSDFGKWFVMYEVTKCEETVQKKGYMTTNYITDII